MKKYPDITRLLKAKDEHRRELAALPFEEKIELVFRIRERRGPIKPAKAGAARGAKASGARRG